MKARILSLVFCVAAIGAVGCNKTNDTWGATGAGTAATSRPAYHDSTAATQPDTGTPADRSPDAVDGTANGTVYNNGATGSSATAPSATAQPIPSESHQVKEDSKDIAKDTAKAQRDEIYTRLYKQFLQETPGKHVDTSDNGKTIDVPARFKSACKDVGKDGKLTTISSDFKAFFNKAEVKADCAQAYALDQQADKAK